MRRILLLANAALVGIAALAAVAAMIGLSLAEAPAGWDPEDVTGLLALAAAAVAVGVAASLNVRALRAAPKERTERRRAVLASSCVALLLGVAATMLAIPQALFSDLRLLVVPVLLLGGSALHLFFHDHRVR